MSSYRCTTEGCYATHSSLRTVTYVRRRHAGTTARPAQDGAAVGLSALEPERPGLTRRACRDPLVRLHRDGCVRRPPAPSASAPACASTIFTPSSLADERGRNDPVEFHGGLLARRGRV